MITIVLGAGASHHHNFPTGWQLKQQVINELKEQNSNLASLIRATSSRIGAEQPRKLSDALSEHVGTSIDDFLQTRANRAEFYDVAKLAMAALLLERERVEILGHDECWYRYLLNLLLPHNDDDAIDTGVRVVTFNFDRSFEFAARQHAARTWRVSIEEATPIVDKILPVAHVHGALSGDYGHHYERSYSPGVQFRMRLDRDILLRSAEGIAVAGDSVNLPDHQVALEWIRASACLVFLGFGFHDFALSHLQLPQLFTGDLVTGTTFKLDKGRASVIQSRFSRPIDMRDVEILPFLRDHMALHLPDFRRVQ